MWFLWIGLGLIVLLLTVILIAAFVCHVRMFRSPPRRVLGEDEYFVLGDNRLVSLDSRDSKVGAVSKEELEGVVFLRIYPWSAFGTVK